MTSKRDLRAQVERLTAQLELARGERRVVSPVTRAVIDRLLTERNTLHERVIELERRVQELTEYNQVTVNNMTMGRFPDVRSLSIPDEAA